MFNFIKKLFKKEVVSIENLEVCDKLYTVCIGCRQIVKSNVCWKCESDKHLIECDLSNFRVVYDGNMWYSLEEQRKGSRGVWNWRELTLHDLSNVTKSRMVDYHLVYTIPDLLVQRQKDLDITNKRHAVDLSLYLKNLSNNGNK